VFILYNYVIKEKEEQYMTRTSLNGTWKLRGRRVGSDDAFIEIPATVPGCVQLDLSENGYLPADLYMGENILETEKFEDHEWWYERTFACPEQRDNVYLVFEGVDCLAEYYLNGVKLGESKNAFISHEFRIDGHLRDGENTVKIVFASPILAVGGLESLSGAFTRERMHTRRIQCTYGWDWVERFISSGVRAVKIECEKDDEILVDNAYIYTRSYDSESADVVVDIRFKEHSSKGIVNFSIRNSVAYRAKSNNRTTSSNLESTAAFKMRGVNRILA
jgi:beta-mannosidase